MNVESMEQYLQKIRSVIACRIIVNENQQIEEIHILSGVSRNAKQILRDVEAILLTRFNVSIDHKKVSIAQIEDNILENDEKSRLKLNSVEYHNQGSRGTIKVILQKNEDIYENSVSGMNTINNLKRLVGNCVLKIVEQYCGIEDLFNLEDVKIVKLSDCDIVATLVSYLYKGQEQILSGTAIVKNDINEAVARATLDAVNRCMVQIHNY